MPGTGYKEEEKNYAISFVIPRDIEGLTVVETRHPSDMREFEEGFDNPVKIGGITQAYLLFDDVHVPKERVFMCREHDFSGMLVERFAAYHRQSYGHNECRSLMLTNSGDEQLVAIVPAIVTATMAMTMTRETQEGTPGMKGRPRRPRAAMTRTSKNRSMTRDEIPVG
jgi:hypothetical protein